MMPTRRSGMDIRFGKNDLHFRHRDHRQEPDEKQEEGSENPKGAYERPDIDPGRDE